LNNVTPTDVYTGRNIKIMTEREKIKKKTMQMRRIQNLKMSQQNEIAC
jgi:putative transposase